MFIEVRDSRTGCLLPVRHGPGALPDGQSCWDAVAVAAAVSWFYRACSGIMWAFKNTAQACSGGIWVLEDTAQDCSGATWALDNTAQACSGATWPLESTAHCTGLLARRHCAGLLRNLFARSFERAFSASRGLCITSLCSLRSENGHCQVHTSIYIIYIYIYIYHITLSCGLQAAAEDRLSFRGSDSSGKEFALDLELAHDVDSKAGRWEHVQRPKLRQ